MSSNLFWQPVKESWHDLPKELKFAMQKRYDGFIHSFLNVGDIPYLEGLRDGGVSSAQKLIDAIEKYGDIEIKEIF